MGTVLMLDNSGRVLHRPHMLESVKINKSTPKD